MRHEPSPPSLGTWNQHKPLLKEPPQWWKPALRTIMQLPPDIRQAFRQLSDNGAEFWRRLQLIQGVVSTRFLTDQHPRQRTQDASRSPLDQQHLQRGLYIPDMSLRSRVDAIRVLVEHVLQHQVELPVAMERRAHLERRSAAPRGV